MSSQDLSEGPPVGTPATSRSLAGGLRGTNSATFKGYERTFRMPVQPFIPGMQASPSPQPQGSSSRPVPAREPDQEDQQPTPIWLQRMSLFILVLFCIYLGVLVVVVPWWPAVWDHNGLLLSHPHLWAVLRKAPVRGVISGLGLLDIWIGISEAVHYREYREHQN